MVKTRRVICVVLAVMMIVSCFAFSSSAATTAPTYTPTNTTGTIKITTTADKTTAAPGDIITFSLHITPGSYTDWGAFGNTIVYNSNLVTPCTTAGVATTTNTEFRTWQNQCATWTNPSATCNFNYAATNLSANFTTEEQAYYNKCVLMLGTVWTANGVSSAAGNGWLPAANEVYCTFQMKVSDTAVAGDEIYVGLHQATFTKGVTYFAPASKTRYQNTEYNLTDSMAKVTVASAGPSVAKSSSQIKMTVTSATTVADDFQFRVKSTITDSDFDTYFANTGVSGATTNCITGMGIVAYTGTGTFSADTAKAVVAGTATTDYTTAATDYLQKADDTSAAYFGAIMKMSKTSKYDTTYMGYVKYLDSTGAAQTIFYPTSYTAALSTNYSSLVSSYLVAYPYA